MLAFLKKNLLVRWYTPLLLFLAGCGFFISAFYYPSIPTDLVIYSGIFATILLFTASIWQFIQGRWYIAMFQLIMLFVGGIGTIYFSFLMLLSMPSEDAFATNLVIPSDIPIHKPIPLGYEIHRPEKVDDSVRLKRDFQLYESFQPGLYEYDYWGSFDEPGTLYLKAYEITQEYRLSKSTLKEKSSIEVSSTGKTIIRFETQYHFTIYEGDWGNPYAARFEVWFQPKSGDSERKLFEKNYVIEGWMR